MIFFLFDFLWQCMRISASFMLFSIVFLTLVTRLDVFISIFPETSPICSMLCPTKSSSFLSLVSVSLQYCLEVKTQFAHLLIWYISCSLHFHSKLWIHVHFSQYFSSSHLFFFFALSVVADFPFRVVRWSNCFCVNSWTNGHYIITCRYVDMLNKKCKKQVSTLKALPTTFFYL